MKNIHLIKTDKPSRLHLDKTKYLSYDLGFYSKDNKSFLFSRPISFTILVSRILFHLVISFKAPVKALNLKITFH